MELTPLPALSLRDLVAANEASTSRSAGCHVTDCVRAILETIDPQRYRKPDTRATETIENWQEAGFLWEDLLSKIFAARIGEGPTRFRPGELVKDRIIGSPDAIAVEPDGALVVEEYKCTWKSSRRFDLYDKRYLWWLIQMQCYCVLAETQQARLYVLHINGNYDGYIPEVCGYDLRFSPRELDDQWRSVQNMARKQGWI